MKKIAAAFWVLILCGIAGMFLALPPSDVQAQAAASQQYKYISTATTTAVRDGAGYLGSVIVNGGTAGAVTLYDIAGTGCTGTPASGKFATIEAISATNPTPLAYNLRVTSGICVVTAQATDLTVTWN